MNIVARVGRFTFVGSVAMGLAVLHAGCLARPTAPLEPTTKVNFSTTLPQQAVDKIDLLLAIDNSRSMADKQQILAEAVPDLLVRLLRPRCVDSEGNVLTDDKGEPRRADPTKSTPKEQCQGAGEPEFKPIADIHIGVVSSSLGSMGGNVCPLPQQDDHARLVARMPPGTSDAAVSKVADGGYLAWFPDVASNQGKVAPPVPIGDEATLREAFKGLVKGAGQQGCGLEAQLESVYQFLVQPDPWDAVAVDATKRASLQGYNEQLLKQRKAFLRPDSLVAIVMLTDEDDSSADPLSVGGVGWGFMSYEFPGSRTSRPGSSDEQPGTTAPRGTRACDANPASKDCTSCGFARDPKCDADPACAKIKKDANCTGEFKGDYGPTEEPVNVRFHRMKQRYGIDPQYPIKRYVDGLQQTRVPNRDNEHNASGGYIGTATCTNPLFAKNLPGSTAEAIQAARALGAKGGDGKALSSDADLAKAGLCNLERGQRSPDLVYFAVVGGAPNDLLFDGAYTDAPRPKAKIDFVRLTGNDPNNYDLGGLDPHMVQSVDPRPGLPPPPADANALGDNGPDPAHGREWDTSKSGTYGQKEDLQFACTFPLDVPRDCVSKEPGANDSCDCGGAARPPLCGGPKGTMQLRAKAYPTIRQFSVVRGLGDQGIAASLCPLTDARGKLFPVESDFYGYRPAVASIFERLRNSLTTQCLPQALTRDDQGEVACSVLETLPKAGPQSSCNDASKGLSEPKPEVLEQFLAARERRLGKQAADALKKYPVCEVRQLVKKVGESCAADAAPGWCYVTGKAAGSCPQAIKFSQAGNPEVGATTDLTCIQQYGAGVAAGAAP